VREINAMSKTNARNIGTTRRSQPRGAGQRKSKLAVLYLLALCLAWVSISYGQEGGAGGGPPSNTAATDTSAVPRLINFSGTISPQITQISQNETQTPGSSRAINVTFSLYELQEGGTPLWSESQRVQLDDQGHYTVLLGSTQPEGLPLDLFTSGKAQWLGVQPQLPGAVEQPRVMLVGMPYALKASDADTLGGLPASAFLQAAATAQAASASVAGQSSNALSGQGSGQDSGAPLSVSGTGTTDYLPLWTNSTTLGNSVLFQSGTGSTAKVGLNTTSPATALDVNGAGTVRGTLSLPATGTATATTGKNSQPASLQASAFNSITNTAVNQTFNLQAEPTGNDTSSPSGKLNLLFASGSGSPAETGLSIAGNGRITFAAGQTFPGTGTITGVTTPSGSGLTGGGTTGTLTLSLEKTCATSQLLEWNGSSWVCSSAGTGTITGVTAGTDLTGGGTSGTVTLNLDITKVPQLNAANTFTGWQTINGGDLHVTSGNIDLPQTVNATTGVINLGGTPFIHACCSSGSGSTFVGYNAGGFSGGGGGNTAVGSGALSTPGHTGGDTAIGFRALASDTGGYNTATGSAALANNTGGQDNAAFGVSALGTNTSGTQNTALGYAADVASGGLLNATAIGANAVVAESNALVLGCTPATCSVTFGTTPPNVGIGTQAPGAALEVDSGGGYFTPQAYLVQTNTSDYSRLRFNVTGAAEGWDIAVGGGSAPAMNFYRSDVGNAISLTPSGTQYLTMGNGAYLSAGGAWTNASDRHLKAHIRPVSGRDVLRRLSVIPITTWSYKTEGSGVRHIGPMAQDFRAAFGLGDDDKHITTIDEGGVALAAIQELYRQDLQKSAQIEQQKEQITTLRAEVEKLQQVQERLAALETRLALMEASK